MMNRFIVTIDGPAGSGKSTIAKKLAKNDNFLHIDTGAIYRAIGYIFNGVVTKQALDEFRFDITQTSTINIFYNGTNIEEFIRSEECGMLASKIATLDFVRSYVNEFARVLAVNGRYVIDGRDCGSVIFPNANIKFFLTASLQERAKRRALEDSRDFEAIKSEIKKRDEQDMKRDIAPLVKPKDAVVVDTSNLEADEVYKIVKGIIEDAVKNNYS